MKLKNIHSVSGFRLEAKNKLPSPIFEYLDGGSDDEWSLKNNQQGFEKYELLPRYLRDISNIDTSTEIVGARIKSPIVLSPTGMSRLFHHEKELAVAGAADKAGLIYSLSTMATTSIEEIAEATMGPKIYQIYIHKDRKLTEEFVDRAKEAKYDALCLTVDTPKAGNRERDKHSGFEMPPRFTLSSLLSFAFHPYWTFHFLKNPDFSLANIVARQDTLSKGPLGVIEYVNQQFDRTVTWDDAATIIQRWGGPFLIKGLQTEQDAARALSIGATGIMISNHGGRQLDWTPAPLDCVASIRDTVGDEFELIVDGGIRRGTDIIKAIGLGADAVSIGRPYLYALAAHGQEGVERVLMLLQAELERNMALMGLSRLEDISQECLKKIGV